MEQTHSRNKLPNLEQSTAVSWYIIIDYRLPDLEIVSSGSGSEELPDSFVDTEDGDDVYEEEKVDVAGSGWQSNIIRITPFETWVASTIF